jgi:hypothetical protein
MAVIGAYCSALRTGLAKTKNEMKMSPPSLPLPFSLQVQNSSFIGKKFPICYLCCMDSVNAPTAQLHINNPYPTATSVS